jgi:hypothetical protein
MSNNLDLRPAAFLAGMAVVGGVLIFSSRKRSACRKLPDIWSEEGPMHLTPSAQDDAFELARYKIREYVLSNAEYKTSDIVMSVADGLRECKWESLETDQQKQVWAGIEQIVKSEIQSYRQNPDSWLASF